MPCRPVIWILLLAVLPAGAQQSDDPLDTLVEEERARQAVETAFVDVREARSRLTPQTFVDAYVDIAYELGNSGPGVVDLLASEALAADQKTFFLSTLALGYAGTPKAVEALWEAVLRAEDEGGEYAIDRKTELLYALAIAGDVEVLAATSAGRHDVAKATISRGLTLLEAASILLAPESIERLNKELLAEDLPAAGESERTFNAIRAVARIAHPSSLPVLLHLLRGEDELASLWTAYALSLHPQKAAVDALFEELEGDHPTTVANAASALMQIMPAERYDELLEKLPKVQNEKARASIYHALISVDPASAPTLAKTVRVRSRTERLGFCQGVARVESEIVLDTLIDLVADGDAQVAVCAIRALTRFENPRARRVLFRAIDSPRWPVAQQAAKWSADLGVAGAAPVIRRRLLEVQLPAGADAREAKKAEWLLTQLVRLTDLEVIDPLEAALAVQPNPTLRTAMTAALVRLRAVRDAGKDPDKWEAAVFSEDSATREAAYDNVGHALGAEKGATLLVRAFGRVEYREGQLVLEHLAELDTTRSRNLVETILTDSAFLAPEFNEVRDAAAWAARRYGGPRMIAALARVVEQRKGRDFRSIVYYAILHGADAVPLIEGLHHNTVRFRRNTRGLEFDFVHRVLASIKTGRSLAFADRSPQELRLN